MNAYADENDMQELLQVFIAESGELLDEVEPLLIELQEWSEQPGEAEEDTLNSIFRIFHTIKGSAGFLNLNTLQEVTHEAETLLDHYRKGYQRPTLEHIGLLLYSTDFIRKLMVSIEKVSSDRGFEPQAQSLKRDLMLAATNGHVSGGESAPSGTTTTEPMTSPVPEPGETPIPEPSGGSESVPAEHSVESTPDDSMMLAITGEMTEQYVREALEILETLEQTILEMEQLPDSQDYIDRAFRCLHTLKGNSGLLGYQDLERLSHRTESLFDRLRSGAMRPNREITRMVLSILDYLRATVVEVSKGGTGTIQGCDLLMGFIDDTLAEAEHTPGDEPEPVGIEEARAVIRPVLPETVPEATAPVEAVPLPTEKPPVPGPSVRPPAAGPALPAKTKEQAARPVEQIAAPKDIRVDLERVDKLVDLVGELALAEMMVVQNPALKELELEGFDRAVHHLDRVISELQYVSMSLRMIPIAATFRKLIRLVHDLSYKSSKSVKLVTLGEDTEVDKTVVDLIADPLIHIVRNAIDHGIEHPEDRKTAGKPETGTVTIEAKHEGGEVWIAVIDDGRGLSREKILKKAHQMGLIEGDGAEMRDEDVYKLILEPGFSTAETITEVSGRGVGMDVVQRNLERINGHVDISSTPGQGSRFTLRTPLTLALMDGMLVRVGTTRYIVPLLSIRECIRPRPEDITVTPDGQEIVRVREELVPILRLHLLHNITPEHLSPEETILLMVEYRGDCFSIMVDAVLGQQQAVVKGLSDYVDAVRGVSGCTILGDGTVSLILDIGSLWEMASREGTREGAMAGI